MWALANLASVDHSRLQLLELGAVQRLVQWMQEEAPSDASMLHRQHEIDMLIHNE